VLKEIRDNLPLKALKERNSIAQGIALGEEGNQSQALKGRHREVIKYPSLVS
jgi:hypothetical protein